jgi:predicted transcriptional regulator
MFSGAVLLALADEELTRIGELDDETRAAIREGLERARRGDFVAEEQIEAIWQRFGL